MLGQGNKVISDKTRISNPNTVAVKSQYGSQHSVQM